MENVLAVSFAEDAQAYEAMTSLKELDTQQQIALQGAAVVVRDQDGHLEIKELQVDVHPHAYLGKVLGCSSWLSTGKTGFSSSAGIAPTFILDTK